MKKMQYLFAALLFAFPALALAAAQDKEPTRTAKMALITEGKRLDNYSEARYKKHKKNKHHGKKHDHECIFCQDSDKKNIKLIEQKDLLKLIKDADPALSKKLETIKEDAPGEYKRIIRNMQKKVSALKSKNAGSDKKIIEEAASGIMLGRDIRETVKKYRKAEKAEKPAMKAELKAKLEQMFDIRLKEHKARLNRMKTVIAEQERKLEERSAAKSKIVEARLDELTDNRLRW